jgi:hypothetical protein
MGGALSSSVSVCFWWYAVAGGYGQSGADRRGLGHSKRLLSTRSQTGEVARKVYSPSISHGVGCRPDIRSERPTGWGCIDEGSGGPNDFVARKRRGDRVCGRRILVVGLFSGCETRPMSMSPGYGHWGQNWDRRNMWGWHGVIRVHITIKNGVAERGGRHRHRRDANCPMGPHPFISRGPWPVSFTDVDEGS